MEKIIVSTIGITLIAAIYWFFFGKKDEAVTAGSRLEIIVSGGYKPSVIKIKKNQTTILSIKRTEDNSCLEEIVLPDFKIKEYLPLNKTVEIKITPTKLGEFNFHCGMNMFHGKVIVE